MNVPVNLVDDEDGAVGWKLKLEFGRGSFGGCKPFDGFGANFV